MAETFAIDRKPVTKPTRRPSAAARNAALDLHHLQAPSHGQADAATSLPAGPHVALIPGAVVPALPVQLPTGLSGAPREAVARRQLCDQLGLSEADHDLRPLELRAANWRHMLLCDQATLSEWRARCASSAQALLPDYLSLPAGSGVWSLAPSPSGDLLVRLGPEAGFAAPPDLALRQLTALWAETEPENRPKAMLCAEDLQQAVPQIGSFAEERNLPLAATADVLPDGCTAVRFAHGELQLDLRRDAHRARRQLAEQIRPWRWSLLAAALATALWSGGQWSQIRQLEAEAAQLANANEAMVRQTFVPDGPLLDLRLQVARVLSDRQAAVAAAANATPDGPLAVLALAAPVLHNARTAGVRLREVRFDPATGVQLDIAAPDFAALDQLQSDLAGNALQVGLQNSRTLTEAGESGVAGILVLEAGS
jgi:general secretion pathway protein L